MLYKLAAVVWIISGITIAGILGTVVLATPSLEREAVEMLPWAALAGFALAIPVSMFIAKRIMAGTRGV